MTSTKWGMIPVLEFASSESGVPIPEFYNEYPILTTSEIYDSIDFKDFEFYKIVPKDALVPILNDRLIVEGYSLAVQIIPDENIDSFSGEITSLRIYCCCPLGNDYPGSSEPWVILDSSQYTVDYSTGVITITDTAILNTIADRMEEFNDTYIGTPFFIFEVHVARYRPITDTSNYLKAGEEFTESELNRMSTMQAVEASVLEYLYQYNLASQTQTSMCEIGYTSIITVISTAITIGISAAANTLIASAYSGSCETISKLGQKMVAHATKGSIALNKFVFVESLIKGVQSEIMQELFLDPWIENLVTGFTKSIGLPEWAQMFFSTLAEGLRETITGPIANLFGGQPSSLLDTQQFKHMTALEQIQFMQQHRTQIQQSVTQSWLGVLGSSVFSGLGFLFTAWSGTSNMFLSPVFSMSIATFSIYCKTEEISLKDSFAKLFGKVKKFGQAFSLTSVQDLDAMVGSPEVSNHKKYNWGKILRYTILGVGIGLTAFSIVSGIVSTLSAAQVPGMPHTMVDSSKGLAMSTNGVSSSFSMSITTSIGASNIFVDTIKDVSNSPYIMIGILSSAAIIALLGSMNSNSRKNFQISLAKEPQKIVQIRKGELIWMKNKISEFLKSKKSMLKVKLLFRDKITDVQILKNKIDNAREFNSIRPLESRITIFTHTVKKLMKLYERKDEILLNGREIFGLIYLVIDWETGEIFFTKDGERDYLSKVGRTETPLINRISVYRSQAKALRDQIEEGKNIPKGYKDSIYEKINELYEKGGMKLVKEMIEWFPIEIVLRTGSSQENIEFDKIMIENLEQWWQNKLETAIKFGKGYDQADGAQGRHAEDVNKPYPYTREIIIPRVLLNWRHLKNVLEKGFETIDQCVECFNRLYSTKFYLGFEINKDIFKENVRYHFPGIIKRTGRTNIKTIYADAKSYFIGRLIKRYVQEGMVKEEEIAQKFVSTDNPQGISRKTIVRIAKKEFQASSWAITIIKLGGIPTQYSLSHLSIEDFKEAGGEKLDEYWKWRVSTYIIKGYSPYEMINERLITEMSYKTLIRRIGDYQYAGWWRGYKNAQRELVAPILALCYKLGYTDQQTVQAMPFFQRISERTDSMDRRLKDPISAIEYYTLAWFEDTPAHARLFLSTHSLQEYLDRYLRTN